MVAARSERARPIATRPAENARAAHEFIQHRRRSRSARNIFSRAMHSSSTTVRARFFLFFIPHTIKRFRFFTRVGTYRHRTQHI